MRGPVATFAFSIALAACGQGAQPTANVTSVRVANPQSDQLKGMSDLYRNLGLRRAIMDSGQKCKRSEGGAYQQEYKNMAMWTTRCIDTGEWAIFIAPGGEVQVRPCADLASLGLPTCRRPATPPGQKAPAKGDGKGQASAAASSVNR